ncbi:MAG: phosphoribosyltransferase [Rickettsiaceae bacterium]|jgi:ATP phosphoribosyltransferase|nr:phosphoribosyltransferase [Rickettsiaceae bacterium]
MNNNLIIAIPKGRILTELGGLFSKIGFVPEDEFYDDKSRKLIFESNIENLKIIKVRSFDVATFVKFGAADFGICGLDVLKEFSSPDIYPLLDLEIGKCRLSIASRKDQDLGFENKSHLRIATKYLNLTADYFSAIGIQAECIKLNGAMELAPHLNLCDYIVDLVSTGNTLRENSLVEVKKILEVSSYLIANRHSFKAKNQQLLKIIKLFDVNALVRN